MIRRPQRAKAPQRQQISNSLSRVAPVRGWNTRDPLSAMRPDYARVLENFFPTASGVSLRQGCSDHVVSVPGNVKTLMPFQGPASSKLFAASDTKIFDATASASNPAQLVARTKGEHVYVNFTTTGNSYLLAVNGVDDLALYTASTNTWSTVASFPVTGGGTLLTNSIAYVATFKRALFFLTNNATGFYYLPIDQISGTVSYFPLGGLLDKGGSVLAFGTWSVDAGSGQDDYGIFFSTRGQAIVYRGTDPSAAATWALQGRYALAPPLGVNCLRKVKGDLYVLTESGLFSMNTAFASTTSSLTPGFTDAIAPTFREFAALSGSTYGWQTELLEREKLLIVNVPQQSLGSFNQFVMNLDTGAWCRFTGWNAYNFAVLDKTLYFCTAGKVAKAWQPGGDFGSTITATAAQAFDYLQPRALQKSFSLVRPVYTISGRGTATFALSVDFRDTANFENNVTDTSGSSVFDTGIWDAATFAAQPTPQLNWQTLSAPEGYCVSVLLRLVGQDATFSWTATDYVYQTGSPV